MTAESDAYEELTCSLFERLAGLRGVTTVRLERNVVLRGKATQHQVDVIWQFLPRGDSTVRTVLFECRHYRDPIKKGRLLEFKGVVDDIANYDGPDRILNPSGSMVTLSRYQIGAQRVASTYGLTISELRPPTSADLANRALEVRLTFHARLPRTANFSAEPADPVHPSHPSSIGAMSDDVEIELHSGLRVDLVSHLLRGELSSLKGPPTSRHRVVRVFEPPAALVVSGEPILSVRAVAADVWEDVSQDELVIGGREHLSYVLVDALNGERVWFAEGGRTWSTDVPLLR